MKELAISMGSVHKIARVARQADVINSSSLWTHFDCAVAGQFTSHGFAASLEPMLIRTVALNQLLSTRFTTTAQRSRAVALLQKFGATTRLSPRYGNWDLKNFAVTGTATPSFLRLNSTTAPAS